MIKHEYGRPERAKVRGGRGRGPRRASRRVSQSKPFVLAPPSTAPGPMADVWKELIRRMFGE